jgi:hypothetical protein
MTGEGLHAKSDIAAELAWRDVEIEKLRAAALAGPKMSELDDMRNDRDGWKLAMRNEAQVVIKIARERDAAQEDIRELRAEVERLRQHVAEAVARETERCITACRSVVDAGPENGCCPTFWNEGAEACEKAIHAGAEKETT